MPKWGLTEDQRRSRPWGIPDGWLEPGKTITDPVHGDIYINRLEQALLDSPPLQRLRRVRQLGTAHLVYPGATHTRLSHAMGTLRAAQDLLDAVIENRTRPRPAADFFQEWSTDVPPGRQLSEFDSELAKVTVLVRLGALLHDLNHVAFGHTIEDDLEVLKSHDHNHARLDRLWAQFRPDVRAMLDGTDPVFVGQVRKLIVSKDDNGENWTDESFAYPFVADIVGNTICADLIDYLARDHKFTGLPIALGDRFKDEFYVSPSSEVHFPRKMVIRVTRHGHERHDVITELLKYLRYRYELSERALAHHAKLAADAMIGKLLEMRSDWLWWNEAVKRQPEAAAKHRKDIDALRRSMHEIGGDLRVGEITQSVEVGLETDFLAYGDDGLLERLRDWGIHPDGRGDGRREAVGTLAEDVLNRHLYKGIGRADARHDIALSQRIYDKFGKRTPRRALEESAASWAGVEQRWGVVIWLPSPTMRLKIAEVLVDHNGRINHLDRIAQERAEDIYNAHQTLWGVSVYARSTVDRRAERRLLAYLGQRLGVAFLDGSGQEAPTVADLLIEELEEELQLSPSEKDFITGGARGSGPVLAHAGEAPTFDDLVQRERLRIVAARAADVKADPP
jgi:HD superfamily phosphohydrolase